MRYHSYSRCRDFEGGRSIARWAGALCLGFALTGLVAGGAQAQKPDPLRSHAEHPAGAPGSGNQTATNSMRRIGVPNNVSVSRINAPLGP